MTIRPAASADLPAVAEIWNHAIRETVQTFNSIEKTLPELETLLSERQSAGHALLVADVGGVLGFGTYGQFRGGVGYSHTMEHTLYMADAARGQGLGRAMMVALEAHARAGGAHSLIGGIAGDNVSGITFHERMGYDRIATLPEVGFKFGRWMDLVLLQKILT
ncbi:MAG: N-acetyltransferase family protein [Pseudomonadota bacterium]